jgi:hypothetical protein
MMAAVMATVVGVVVVRGAIVTPSLIVIISVPGIIVAAVVIPRSTAETDAETLCLRLAWSHSQQSQDRQYKKEKFFHLVLPSQIRRNNDRSYSERS